MKPASPKHLTVWVWCLEVIRSAPRVLDRRLALASMKRWSDMWNKGTRMAQMAWNIHLGVKCSQTHIRSCPGCALRIALSSVSASTRPEETICPSVCRGKKGHLKVELRLIQAMKREFWGVAWSVWSKQSFLIIEIPKKMWNSQMCWVCANLATKETISEGNAPRNVLGAVFEILQTHFICKVLWSGRNSWCSLSWVRWGQLRSVVQLELVKTQANCTRYVTYIVVEDLDLQFLLRLI
jgi:hypothetical protein